jgi:hypothetical protein
MSITPAKLREMALAGDRHGVTVEVRRMGFRLSARRDTPGRMFKILRFVTFEDIDSGVNIPDFMNDIVKEMKQELEQAT